MMFKTVLVTLAAIASVSALPFNDPRSVHTGVRVIGLSLRSIEPEAVPEIVVRGEHYVDVEKRVNIPAEFPVKSDANKQVVPYNSKRDEIEERDVDDLEERDYDDLEERDYDDLEERDYDDLEEREFEDFEERDEDDVEFAKRQIPEEQPTKGQGGQVVPYKRQIPEEQPTKGQGGQVVPYRREENEVPFHKRVIPSEIAVRTNEHGEIVPY